MESCAGHVIEKCYFNRKMKNESWADTACANPFSFFQGIFRWTGNDTYSNHLKLDFSLE